MAAEPYVITNPQNSERVLTVLRRIPGGGTKTVAVLRPGEHFRADLPALEITSAPLPARLVISQDGSVRPDSKRAGPRPARLPLR